MADYTPIDPNSLLPGQPITSALGQALEENPRAQQDFAAGAPINVGIWHPFDADEYGESDGLLYDHASDGAVSSVETPVFDAGYEYKIAFEDLRGSSGAGGTTMQAEARTLSGGSYVSIDGVPVVSDTLSRRRASGEYTARRPFQVAHVKIFDRQWIVSFAGSYTNEVNPADRHVDGARIMSRATADAVDRFRLRLTAGSFDSGKVWLMRRRVEGF